MNELVIAAIIRLLEHCNAYGAACRPFLTAFSAGDFPWQQFFLSQCFVASYCLLIVTFFLCFAVRLWHKVRRLRRKIARVHDPLDAIPDRTAFAQCFHNYDLAAKGEFGKIWNEFVDTLERPPPGSHGPIRNTHDVAKYLNDDTIVAPRINVGFYRSLPNLLTGVGILGTFVGLAAGVGAAEAGLTSGDSAEITGALRRLLAGSSLAFLTSIFGIASSLLFGLFVGSRDRQLRLAVSNWAHAVEFHLEQITPESIGLEQAAHAKSAATQLERFNTELVFSITQALDEGIAGRLLPQLERLTGAVETLQANRPTDTGQVAQQTLERLADALRERTDAQFREMSEVVSHLNDVLQESTDNARRTAADNAQAAADVRNTLTTAVQEMTRAATENARRLSEETASAHAAAGSQANAAFSEVLDKARTTVSASLQDVHALVASLAQAARQNERALAGMTDVIDQGLTRAAKLNEETTGRAAALVERLDGLYGNVRSAHQEISELIAAAHTRFDDTIKAACREIAAAAAPMNEAAQSLRASTAENAKVMAEAVEKSSQSTARTTDAIAQTTTVVVRLEKHQETVTAIWQQYQTRFEAIDASLERAFRQMNDNLSQYMEQLGKFTNDGEAQMARAIGNLTSAINEFNQIGDAVEQLTNAISRTGNTDGVDGLAGRINRKTP